MDLAASKAGVIQATAPIWQALERAVLAGVPFDNPSQFRDRMSQAERAVCRLVLPKPEWGTGFLVGRDTLLTNYHVIEDIHIGATQPDKVTVEFDYISGPNGEKPLKVISCKLAEKWLLAYSETASLDFALVRLERSIGDQPAAQQSDGKRSWLKPVSYVFDAGNPEPIFILQHPQLEPDQSTDPLKVTVGFVNGAPNGTRVHYTTNTMFGSSGSPCFRANWDLVALHHSATGKPANEGIPLKAILDNLMKRNPPVSVGE
ncbi:MAG TPA: serine protease [Planctomycetaceae bacterium]|nr:serine protease [Planctomycetaceae bacterium]